MHRWRGLRALVHDAVEATTDLVEEGHGSAARTTVRILSRVPPLAGPVRAIDPVRRWTTSGILGTVRTVNRGVEALTDGVLEVVGPELPPAAPVVLRSDALGTAAWVGDALSGAVNGAVGDHLHRRGNGLSLGLSLRPDPTHRTGRIAVFVHGLGTTEWSWSFDAERLLGNPEATFASLLQRDLGFSPVFVRYNTGRHVSENGRLLARALEALVAGWPVPVDEVVLVGHSMGGLVARAAGAVAVEEGHAWLGALTRLVCLGTPHQGAGLERLAHLAAGVLGAIDLPGTRIPAAVIRGRSAGIKDLGHGDATDAAWTGRDPDALGRRTPADATWLPGVSYAFVAGAVTVDPEHPVSRWLGDLLVLVGSAEGPSGPRDDTFVIHTARLGGVQHHQLQVHPDVYAQIRRFLEETAPR